MKPHPDLEVWEQLWPQVRALQQLAQKHGINDIFQDNGGKLLQIALRTGLTLLRSREGNDARDVSGREYEVKSVNTRLTNSVSTHHHLNPTILAKYRTVDWLFAFYYDIELLSLFLLTPAQLEPLFSKWEEEWHRRGGKDLNNPKISGSFVRAVGKKIWSTEATFPSMFTTETLEGSSFEPSTPDGRLARTARKRRR